MSSNDGFLLFLREGSLLAQAFNEDAQLTGDAIPIAQHVGNLGSYGWFSASPLARSRFGPARRTRRTSTSSGSIGKANASASSGRAWSSAPVCSCRPMAS